MERYFRVARRCVVKRPRVQRLPQEQFDNCLWAEAHQEVWEQDWDTDDNSIYDTIDNLIEELASAYSAASHTVWEKDADDEEQIKLVSGGITVGDYTYYTVTEDAVWDSDLPVRN